MPHSQFDWQESIKAVEREYLSARIAVKRLSAEVVGDFATYFARLPIEWAD